MSFDDQYTQAVEMAKNIIGVNRGRIDSHTPSIFPVLSLYDLKKHIVSTSPKLIKILYHVINSFDMSL